MTIRSRTTRLSIALHALALPLLLVRPAVWPVVVAVVFADHMLLLWGSLWPRSRIVGPNQRRLAGAGPHTADVALTFDDGPDPEVTPQVLRLLRRHRAQATFFCIGQRAAAHPELVAEITADGHAVENHTYRHSNAFCFFLPRAQAREIDRTQEILTRVGGSAPRFFRAPAGLRNPWLDVVLAARGLTLVSWTRRSFDTVTRDPQRVLGRLCAKLQGGDILVLHDGRSARTVENRPVVVEVLEPLLREIARRDLRCVALSGRRNARSSSEIAVPSS